MTLYICQCPHLLPAKVWTAGSEGEAIRILQDNSENEFTTAIEAASYDMREAYVTDDPLDLYLWISGNRNAQDTKARRAFFASRSIESDIEAIATLDNDSDETRYVAFDGQFTWFDNDREWTLGNQEPVEADDLVHALCEASLVIAFRDNMEQDDV